MKQLLGEFLSSETSEGESRLVMFVMVRKPSRSFGNEEHEGKEENGDDEQDGDWNLIAMSILDSRGIIVDDGTNQSADILRDLVHGNHHSSKVGWRNFRDVQDRSRYVDTVSEADKKTCQIDRTFRSDKDLNQKTGDRKNRTDPIANSTSIPVRKWTNGERSKDQAHLKKRSNQLLENSVDSVTGWKRRVWIT